MNKENLANRKGQRKLWLRTYNWKRQGILDVHKGLHLIETINKCQICETEAIKLHLDHSHKTGKIRCVLCRSCNQGLGFFKDNLKFLRKAIKYLEKEGLSTDDSTRI